MGTKRKDVTKGAELYPPAGIIRKIIYLTAALIVLILVLNIPVITKQGVKGKVINKTIPIIRGYGSSDQSNDVFCNFCNYAGIKATWLMMPAKNSGLRLPISFVKIDNKWRIFDTYHSLYFLNEKNEIASLDDLISNPNIVRSQARDIYIKDIPYANFLAGLNTVDKIDNKRFKQQTPLGRLLYFLKVIK